MENLKIFEEKFKTIIKDSVKNVLLEPTIEENALVDEKWESRNENNLSCSYCRMNFQNPTQQREHYKLDWHRYNLKQSLLAKQPLTEEEFIDKTNKDDLSSISGSDSEKEDTLDTYATAQGKIFLQNNSGQVFSIYKCLLFDRKEEITDGVLNNRLVNCIENKQWTIFMLGGGHFAGAVFKGEEPILHKTFHCYTVRAGQGGSQSSRDSKGGGSQPKSAGASLRRYNEQALVQHVKDIVETWKDEIAKSSLIVYRASGPYNRAVLFGGSTPLLDRADPRLRTIPFSTRRATFTEVKRVHSLLIQASVYDSLEEATGSFAKQKSPETEARRNKIRAACINRAKSRELTPRPLPVEVSRSNSISQEEEELLEAMISAKLDLSSETLEVDFGSLEEFDDSLTPEQRKKTKKKNNKKSKAKKQKEKDEARKKKIIDLLIRGDVAGLKSMIDDFVKNSLEDQGDEHTSEKNEETLIKEFVNEHLDEESNSLLHLAAKNEHLELIKFLVDNQGDLVAKNSKQQTCYTCTDNKEIRMFLREYAKQNPDKFNYNKANIPTNALTVEEMAERKRMQRKVKREKEKEKKKENAIKQVELEEKDRFLKLSDREKRALAAERRILNQSGVVISRCFLCASDMSGKVPFEYSGNRFCSINCLKAHRLSHPVVL